jgi:hypothetical protein
MAEAARAAARALASASGEHKNRALLAMAAGLVESRDRLLKDNAEDVAAARADSQTPAFVDRLTLTESRIDGMARGVRQVAELPDPVGAVTGTWRRPNGLEVGRMRVPLGVIGIIYESRPNVTADAGALPQIGNAVLLRGGSKRSAPAAPSPTFCRRRRICRAARPPRRRALGGPGGGGSHAVCTASSTSYPRGGEGSSARCGSLDPGHRPRQGLCHLRG